MYFFATVVRSAAIDMISSICAIAPQPLSITVTPTQPLTPNPVWSQCLPLVDIN